MRIVFVRHGEPDYAHDCLTERGRIQAKLAAERLREEWIEEIWSSPLGRARETAAETSAVLGLPVQTLDFMEEVTWGSADGAELFAGGHPWAIADEMARQGIELNRPDWRDSPYFRTNRVLDCIDRVEAGIDGWLAGYGYVREGACYQHAAEEKQQKPWRFSATAAPPAPPWAISWAFPFPMPSPFSTWISPGSPWCAWTAGRGQARSRS